MRWKLVEDSKTVYGSAKQKGTLGIFCKIYFLTSTCSTFIIGSQL